MSSKPSAKSVASARRLQILGRVSYSCFLALLLLYAINFWIITNDYNVWNGGAKIEFMGWIILAVGLVMTVLAFFNAAALKALIKSGAHRLSWQSKVAVGLMTVEVIAVSGFVLLILLPILLNFSGYLQDLQHIFARP